MVLFDPPSISIGGAAKGKLSRWTLAAITTGLSWIFLKVESRAQAPLLDLSLLKIQTFWTGNVASLFTFIAYSTVSVLMPFFLERVMGYPTHLAGIFMTAIPMTILFVAPVSGRMSDKVGTKGLSAAGSFVGALALLGMAGSFGAGISGQSSQTVIIIALCSIGLAMGLFQSPNNNAILGSVPLSKLGVASALLATIRNLGLVIGTGMATGLFTWRMNATNGDFIHALHFTDLVAGVVAMMAMVVCLARKRA
jgi:MFS family permease